MMYSAYKLNKQGDNIQPWRTPFPIWNQSDVVLCGIFLFFFFFLVAPLFLWLQQYMNRELPVVKAGFRKGRRTRDQIANICWIMEKAREFQENIYFCFIDYAKAFDCVDHNKL